MERAPEASGDLRIPSPDDHIFEPPGAPMYTCSFKDDVDTQLIKRIGVEQAMFETDHLHADGTWPHSTDVAARLLDGMTDKVADRVLRRNAMELFGIDAATIGIA